MPIKSGAAKIRASVKVEAKGFSEERFLSMSAYNDIPLRDVSRSENGRLTFNTTPKGFKSLKPLARKTGTRIKITEKEGVRFSLSRLKYRKALVFGMFFFMFAVYGLSMFVWSVEAEGDAKYPPEEIVAFLNENGLKFGTFRYRIDTGRLERLILARFPDVAWASVEVTGTRALARAAGVIPESAYPGRSSDSPADIVAKAGGVIERVYVKSGTPVVKRGDIINAGDILVSSRLNIGTEDTGYVSVATRARAEVWARRFYEYKFAVPLNYPVKNFTGNVRRHYSIMVFGVNLGLPRPSGVYRAYTADSTEKQLRVGKNHPLPFALRKETFREYKAARESRTPQEAEQIARAATERKILAEIPGAKIIGRDYMFAEDGDYLKVNVKVTAVERIDKEQPASALD